MTLKNSTIPGELELLQLEQHSLYAQIVETDRLARWLEYLRDCQVIHLRGLVDRYTAVEVEIKRIRDS